MRFRLYPDADQEVALRGLCGHARFVWNLALEQANWYRPEWGPTPGFVAQCRQLTEARTANDWCGHVAAENRESQAVFSCVACGHTAHADVNAAQNILAAGRAVAAQGGAVVVAPSNCEPQRVVSVAA